MNCQICKCELGTVVESTDGSIYCPDCAEDVEVDCPTCEGAGYLLDVVRGWHESPPEKRCGNCGGDGAMPYWRSREAPLSAEEIASIRADMKYAEWKEER